MKASTSTVVRFLVRFFRRAANVCSFLASIVCFKPISRTFTMLIPEYHHSSPIPFHNPKAALGKLILETEHFVRLPAISYSSQRRLRPIVSIHNAMSYPRILSRSSTSTNLRKKIAKSSGQPKKGVSSNRALGGVDSLLLLCCSPLELAIPNIDDEVHLHNGLPEPRRKPKIFFALLTDAIYELGVRIQFSSRTNE